MSNYIALTGVTASEDLSSKQYFAVQMDTSSDRQVKGITNANGERPVGILQNDPDADGKAADVAVIGVCRAAYGGTITRGDKLAVTNEGDLRSDDEVLNGGAVDLHHIAIALESGSDGDIRDVFVFPPQIAGKE